MSIRETIANMLAIPERFSKAELEDLQKYLDENPEIEFVSYDGRYPNLCRGTLVLKVNGKEYNIKYALCSGGSAYFTNNYQDAHVSSGDWTIDESELPEELRPFVKEIEKLVNENIEPGCCGGCL